MLWLDSIYLGLGLAALVRCSKGSRRVVNTTRSDVLTLRSENTHTPEREKGGVKERKLKDDIIR